MPRSQRFAVADALDGEALHRALIAARPGHVIHQLTALPKMGRGARAGSSRRTGYGTVRDEIPPDVQAGIDAVTSMELQILEASGADRSKASSCVTVDGITMGPCLGGENQKAGRPGEKAGKGGTNTHGSMTGRMPGRSAGETSRSGPVSHPARAVRYWSSDAAPAA
jgi:hypothetical protein